MIRARWRTIAQACTLTAAIGVLATASGPRASAHSSPSGLSNGNSTTSTSCPLSSAPNELVLVAGTPQTAKLGTAFAGGLEVQLANTDGCPVTTALVGTPVTFTAPASGASATFAATGSHKLTLGADAAGKATAQMLTANDTARSYTVTASCAYGAVSFSLTNTAAGIPATITPLAPTSRRATVERRYERPLAVRVLDANGNPVFGATVTFSLHSGGDGNQGDSPSGSGSANADAIFDDGASQATDTTGAAGVATSPRFSANYFAGAFTATATATGATGTALFRLRNRAGAPATLTAGVGVAQSTPTGERFAIPLAVTVTDTHGNPVPGLAIRFDAPSSGPSGSFATRRGEPTAVTVTTDSHGIALAPAFTANSHAGGYIVTASVKGARPVAFALVNEVG
jgi:hypothetical protein